MQLKKVSKIFLFLLISTCIFIISCSCNADKKFDMDLSSSLKYKGEIDPGKHEFIFSVKNIGEKEIELEFPTGLEYNYSLGFLSGQEIPSGTIRFEHVDIDADSSDGRTVSLNPNEKLEYTFYIVNYPALKYRASSF